MQVILLERVASLGGLGEEVKVKDGFARNFLLPQGKALRATDANRARFERERDAIEKLNAERREAAAGEGGELDGASFVVIRQASENGQLYGSVAARDIADVVGQTGVKVSRGQVELNQAIKTVGVHHVPIRLHPEVVVTVTVNVARTADEAERQERGENVIQDQADEDKAIAEAQAAELFEAGAEPDELAANDDAEPAAEAADGDAAKA